MSVDWRHAPEHPYPAALDDAYAALTWLADGGGLDVDGERIVTGGASSGGGLAAGLSMLARDRCEVRPRAQLLVYPMLDDHTPRVRERAITDPRVWNETSNRTAWAHYLRDCDPAAVPPYAAPARAEDLADLPPTWLATADLDMFVDENVEYAHRLMRSGVPAELHVYPGAIHGFDVFVPEAAVSRRYVAERDRALASFLG